MKKGINIRRKIVSVVVASIFCGTLTPSFYSFAQKKSQVKNPTTSTEAKKRQEAAEKEIKQTEQQIKENERSVSRGLTELGKLEGDIVTSKKRISVLNKKVNDLNVRISGLENDIVKNEAELVRLREEYLKAIKKMRLAKRNKSDLAFIFASDNFNQAIRRMRYLKEFGSWRDKKSEAIASGIEELQEQKRQLTLAKDEEYKALRDQESARSMLEKQYKQQDLLVADLKKNGDALKSHLSKKQIEANDLRNRVSQLIAEEQRKAEEERARQESLRKAEEARLAEQRRQEEEDRKKEEQENNNLLLAGNREDISENEVLTEAISSGSRGKNRSSSGNSGNKDSGRRQRKQKDSKKESTNSKTDKSAKSSSSKSSDKETNIVPGSLPKNYADARKRTPRSSASSNNTQVEKTVSGGSFESMKGKLPNPVSGTFKLTSRFGQQSLPDLPDVMYDNPGIDAEVSAGANALAVYEGKVSGVYMLPGYNTVVIVNHGNYYTVYGNISTPIVKVGDKVSSGQGLGVLALQEDDSSHGSIHFEVWKNREKLNPQEWLK